MSSATDIPKLAEQDRLIDTKEVAVLVNLSTPHIQRLVRQNKFPKPVKIGLRKNGWRLGVIKDLIASNVREVA